MKRAPSESPVYSLVITWILLVPVLFFVARGAFSFDCVEQNNPMSYSAGTIIDTAAGSVYYRTEQIAMYLIVCLLIWMTLPSSLKEISRRRNLWLILLPTWGVLSIIWSQDAAKSLTAILPMLILTILGIHLTIRFSPKRQIEFFFLVGLVTLALSFVLVVVYPRAGIEHADSHGAWQGLFMHKNHCAIAMSYLLVPAFCLQTQSGLKRLGIILYIVADIVFIAMTQSRTGWVLVVCTLGFIAFVKVAYRVAVKEKALLMLSAGVVCALAALLAVTYMSQLALLVGKDATLTGRTEIWSAIWPILWDRPLLGYGYRAFWLGMHGQSARLEITTGYIGLENAENAVLQIWLELGVFGVLIMFAGFAKSAKDAIVCILKRPSHYTLWRAATLFLTLLALVDGDKIMYPNTIQWVLYVVSSVSLAAEAAKIKHSQSIASFHESNEVEPAIPQEKFARA